MSIESVMRSNHLILFCPLLRLPSVFPSIRVFSNELALWIRWLKYWSFSFSISPSSEYSGLVSLWLIWSPCCPEDSSRVFSSTTIWRHHFFGAQLSLQYLYMTIGKTIILNVQISVSKVMSLLFNMLSRLVIAFLPRSKRLLISWLQSLSAVILEPKKVCQCFLFSPSICYEVMGPNTK